MDDGFIDFKIFIRLIMLELKMVIYPSLPIASAKCKILAHQKQSKTSSGSKLNFLPKGINLESLDTRKSGGLNMNRFSSVSRLSNKKTSIMSDAEVRFIPYMEKKLLSYFIGEQQLHKVCFHQIIDSFKNEIAVLR